MITPSGYMTVPEAIDITGRDLFGNRWTGKEHSARSGLLTREQWKHDCETPSACGSGSGGGMPRPALRLIPLADESRYPWGDPNSDAYQAEREADDRWQSAKRQLWGRLEAGKVEAIVVDPWSGKDHKVRRSFWRTVGAVKAIEKRRAPLPHSSNTGTLYIAAIEPAKARSANDTDVPRNVTGPAPTTRTRVKNEMRAFDPAELMSMKQEAMASQFNASRETCKKARSELLSELADD